MRDLLPRLLGLVVCGIICCSIGYLIGHERGYQEGLADRDAYYKGLLRVMNVDIDK